MPSKSTVLRAGVVTILCGLWLQGAIAQPPPPARAANGPEAWREVLAPYDRRRCEARCRANSQYEICSAPVCAPGAHPMLELRAVGSGTAVLGGRIEIAGHLGRQRDDYVVALAARAGRDLLVRHRLQVLDWNEDRVWARVHEEVDPDRGYELVIVCNLTEGRRAAPVFRQCSNTIHMEVLRR